jgi:CubicO group peptidase (beta-lactamase class C family)
MDSVRLAQAVDSLASQRDLYNIHSLAVMRHGSVVADASFWPSQPGQLHHVASVTKAVTSALIGIAIDQGYIAGVHERVLDFFPDRTIANRTAWKEAMTIEHLLTMTSGLGGVLPYEEEAAAMEASPDWLQFALDLPMTAEPGTVWRYSNPNTFLLSAIITQTTGRSAHEFARAQLFRPLGIVRSIWWPESPQGITDGSGSLMLAPHDLARFGQLFLQRGAWQGRQIISQSWVAESTSPHWGGFQCYLWSWDSGLEIYVAGGAKGQRLVVSVGHDLVATLTGGGYAHEDIERIYREALRSYIFPAVISDAPLPANPAGVAQLVAAIERAAQPNAEPTPVDPLPAIAALISGRTFLMDANPLEILTLKLDFPAGDEAWLRITALPHWIYDDDFQWAAGLDGIERFAPGRLGILAAATGAWQDEETFLMEVDELGNLELWRLAFDFLDGGERVSITLEDPYFWDPDPTLVLGGIMQP